jgi:SAM-dependent methyltransferase
MPVQREERRERFEAHHTKEGKSHRRGDPGKEALVPSMSQLPPRTMWEERYGAEEFVFGTDPNDFLRENLSALGSGNVLCLAEGEGRNAVFLAENGLAVSSVDLTESGVAKTHRLATERGVAVDAVTGDLADFDLGIAKWDAIVSIFAHTPPAIRIELHRRVVASLVPGGVFLLEAYTPAQVGRGTGGPQVPELTMTAEGLRAELAPLEFLTIQELDRDVIEGPGHTGEGAVVQVIARKAE